MAVIGIVGPTASRKMALPLELAEVLGGADSAEIVPADAMQLYRGMDVGTAEISPAERHGIVHRQIGVPDVLNEMSVIAYQRSVRTDVDVILAAGKTPVVVGGPGLYVPGLPDRLDFPGRDRRVRAELESLLEREGPGLLLEELTRKGPQAYEAMDLANTRRLVRALEATRVTGRPYTPRFPRHTAHYPSVRLFGAFWGSDVLNAAIDRRAKEMMVSGLIEETRKLMGRGLADSPTAGKATGYAEVMVVIEGRMRVEEAVESMCLATRRLAKKQAKWLRADPRVEWLDLADGGVPRAAGEILRALEATWQVCVRGAAERSRHSKPERGDVTSLRKGRGSARGGGIDRAAGVARY